MKKTGLPSYFATKTLLIFTLQACAGATPKHDLLDGGADHTLDGSVHASADGASPSFGIDAGTQNDAASDDPRDVRDAGRVPDAGGQNPGHVADASPEDSGESGAETDAGTLPDEDITAAMAAEAMGKGVNLGQTFENTQHPRTLEKARAKIDAYYAKGFRNVRIPITWTEPVDGDRLVFDPNVGEINRDHPRLGVIMAVVDYALSLPGMYVVINAHHERELKTHSRAWVLERLWQDIADIFRSRSHRLLFEILNEPHREDADNSPMPAADLRNMTGMAYRKIRAVDPKRIVIIGGNQWFNFKEMAEVWPHLDDVGGGDDPYVMSTFHHYNPWSFCGDHQGDYADTWSSDDIENPMDVMASWATSVGRGMPVYIGEWGVGWGSRYDTMECNNIRLWYQMFHHDIARHKHMPTSLWDDGGWFKVFDHATDSFANNLADCISGSCDWQSGERFNSGCH